MLRLLDILIGNQTSIQDKVIKLSTRVFLLQKYDLSPNSLFTESHQVHARAAEVPYKGIALNQMHWAQQHVSVERMAAWRLFEEQQATACRMGVGVGDDCRGGGESGDGQ
jgi:hypothetical protein